MLTGYARLADGRKWYLSSTSEFPYLIEGKEAQLYREQQCGPYLETGDGQIYIDGQSLIKFVESNGGSKHLIIALHAANGLRKVLRWMVSKDG